MLVRRSGATLGRRFLVSASATPQSTGPSSYLDEFKSQYTATFANLERVCKSVAKERKFNEKGSSACAPYFALTPGSHPYRDHVTGNSLLRNTQRAVDRLRSMVATSDDDENNLSRKYDITPAEYVSHVEDLSKAFPKKTLFSEEYEAWLQEEKGYSAEEVEKHRWTYEKVLSGESLLRERSAEEREAEGPTAPLFNSAELKEKGDNVLSPFEESMLNSLESSRKALSQMGKAAQSLEANRVEETKQSSLERHRKRWDELYASAIDREEVVTFRNKFEAMLRLDPRIDASLLLLIHYKSVLPQILSQLDHDTDQLPDYQKVLWELNVNNKALSELQESDFKMTFLQLLDKLPHLRDQLSTEIENQEYDISCDKYQQEIDEKPDLLRLSQMNRAQLEAYIEETHDAVSHKIQSEQGAVASSDSEGEEDSEARKKSLEGMAAVTALQAKIDAHKRAQEKEETDAGDKKEVEETSSAAATTTTLSSSSSLGTLSETENEALFDWVFQDVKDDAPEEDHTVEKKEE